jgi:hypothetical protein
MFDIGYYLVCDILLHYPVASRKGEGQKAGKGPSQPHQLRLSERPSSTPLTPEEQQREAYTGLPKRHGTFIHPLGSGHSGNKTQQSPSEEEEEKGEDDDKSKDSSGSIIIIIINNGS